MQTVMEPVSYTHLDVYKRQQNEDMDIDSFKKAVDGIDEWYQKELEDQGYEDAKELIAAFQ